ncbi:MAG TPA: flagellar biosynthetic protein FliR [Burkholderiaceae bacterium]|nr:flagellar biosynthetic protein FliR [Burkholderiaceae bacterium]
MLLTSNQIAAWAGYLFWPLVRILALIGTVPVLSHRSVPLRVKVAIGVALALVLAPTIPTPALHSSLDAAFFETLVRNVLVGATLGFAIRILFTGIELAGQMIGLQVGLSFGGFFNPEAADTDNPVANFVSLLVLLLFLAMDGHLMVLYGLRQSFEVFPIAQGTAPHQLAFDAIAGLGAQVFSIALSISLPVLAVMLLINVVLGVMARVSPQLNLFAVGFPITLCAGMVVLFLFVPHLEAPIRGTLERAMSIWPGG